MRLNRIVFRLLQGALLKHDPHHRIHPHHEKAGGISVVHGNFKNTAGIEEGHFFAFGNIAVAAVKLVHFVADQVNGESASLADANEIFAFDTCDKITE